MSLLSFVRSVIGVEEPTIYVEGAIVEAPRPVDGKDAADETVVFRLDSRPDLEFRQVRSALAAERRRGERVRVHYRGVGPVVDVQWIEKI